MTSRDVDRVRWQLTTASEAARRIAVHLEDLHDQAFLRHVGDFEHVAGGADHPGVETTGDLRARVLWNALCATATDLDTLLPLERKIGDYFMAGRGPDAEAYRGSLISRGDFVGRLRNQRRQAAAGEYVPPRLVDQPPYPGNGR